MCLVDGAASLSFIALISKNELQDEEEIQNHESSDWYLSLVFM